MNNRPNLLARNGTYIVCTLLLICIMLSGVFKYPDMITARVTILSDNPPVKLVAKNSLPIQSLFVANDTSVVKDQVLCVFSNAAKYDDVAKTIVIVKLLDTALNLPQSIQSIQLPPHLQLGILQTCYVELYQALDNYKFFKLYNPYSSTITSLGNQINFNTQLKEEQQKAAALQLQKLRIQQRQFSADSALVEKKVISKVEYEQAKQKVLEQQLSVVSNQTNKIQSQLERNEYIKNIALTTLQKQKEENDLLQKVKDAVKGFIGQHAQWEQDYVLKSPADGTVSFFNIWKENQFVTAGEGIMMVIPPTQQFIVRGKMNAVRYGKIKPKQKVLLKLQAYPYEEYGMLEAKLIRKTIVPMDTNYVVEMQLQHGLQTNSGKTIPVAPSLDATAEIITDNKSVLARLLESMIGKLK